MTGEEYREQWIAEKRREVAGLQDVATNVIVPSHRDFSQFIASQRRELALVPRLKRRDPQTGGEWLGADLVALARAFDETEVAAIAVCTAAMHGGIAGDLELVRAAASAPLLRDDLCLDELQLYDSRLRGADAVRIPLAELAASAVERLADIAVSMHMTPVLEVTSEEELRRAPLRAAHCVGLSCVGADGYGDLARACALAERVPASIAVVLLGELRTLAEARVVRGHVDAIIVGDALLGSPHPLAEIDRFLNS